MNPQNNLISGRFFHSLAILLSKPKNLISLLSHTEESFISNVFLCNFFIDNSPCEPNPCKNGGICKNAGIGEYTCECKNGYTGRDCQQGSILYGLVAANSISSKILLIIKFWILEMKAISC